MEEVNDKLIEKWSWTEVSNDEFDKMRRDNTYYRIYYKDNDGKSIVVYKFWAKNSDCAYETLLSYKADHKEDGKAYFYSTSGYYFNSESKRFDTMEDMFASPRNRVYDEYDRERDTKELSSFADKFKSEEFMKKILDLKEEIYNLEVKMFSYRRDSQSFFEDLEKTDLSKAPKEKMDDMIKVMNGLAEKVYNIENVLELLKTGHGISESWSLDNHILYDLRFNLKKIIDSENLGYPYGYYENAAKKLGLTITPPYAKHDEEADKLAHKMWKDDILNLYKDVMSYFYYSDYGIFEEDTNPDMVEFVKESNIGIPRVIGTDNEIDYEKLQSLTDERWHKIMQWLDKNGRNLWI